MGGKISNGISSEGTQKIHSPKFMHTPREVLHQRYSKNCEIINVAFCTKRPNGTNVSNDISSESTNQIHSPCIP